MRQRKRAIGNPTKSEQSYQDSARALGCVVCRYRIEHGMQPNFECGAVHIHHINTGDLHGQKQTGQGDVVSMGAWHHDGVLMYGLPSVKAMRNVFGPSFKEHARDFRAWTSDVLPNFEGRGTQRWKQYQDQLLREAQ